MNHKKITKVISIVIALLTIYSGALLTYTYYKPIDNSEIVETKLIDVPADGYAYELAHLNSSGHYVFDDLGNLRVNSTLMTEKDFIAWLNGQYQPEWRNLTSTVVSIEEPSTYILVLSNQDSVHVVMTFGLYHAWTEYNYLGLVVGIALIPVGIAIIYLANKTQIKQFNKALENQE